MDWTTQMGSRGESSSFSHDYNSGRFPSEPQDRSVNRRRDNMGLWDEGAASRERIHLANEFYSALPNPPESASTNTQSFPLYSSPQHSRSAGKIARAPPTHRQFSNAEQSSSGYEGDRESTTHNPPVRRRVSSQPSKMPVSPNPVTVPLEGAEFDRSPRIYGHELYDDRRSVKSMKLAGSKPPSRAGSPAPMPERAHANGNDHVNGEKRRRKRKTSASSVATNASVAGGYLFWKGARDGETAGTSNPPPIPSHVSSSKKGTPKGTPSIRFTGFNENIKTPEELWYFLRCLIGIEIQEECGSLWKLQDLEVHPEDIHSEEEGEDDFNFVGARDTPIMRYLIRNFLLTFPLIRDTPSLYTADHGEFQPHPDDDYGVASMPVFWTRGLLPLLQALHQKDLSEPMDRSERSLWSIIWGIYIRKTLQKFVCGGLKVYSGVEQEDGNRESRFGNRESMYNPLMKSEKKRFSFFPSFRRANASKVDRRATQISQSASIVDSPQDVRPNSRMTINNPKLPPVRSVTPISTSGPQTEVRAAKNEPSRPPNGRLPSDTTMKREQNLSRQSTLPPTTLENSDDEAVTADEFGGHTPMYTPNPYTPDMRNENGFTHQQETLGRREDESKSKAPSASTNGRIWSSPMDRNLSSSDGEVQGYSLEPSRISPGFHTPDPSSDDHGRRLPGIFAMALPEELGPNYRPPRSVPLDAPHKNEVSIDLVPKYGHSWPWGAPVPFWKGTPVHRVAWGGFEVDVVGVRKGLFEHYFIIRVRRPARRDEYVLRNEAQFKKYLGELDKQYPSSHIRRLPQAKDKDDEGVIATKPEKKSKNKSNQSQQLSQRIQAALEDDGPQVNFEGLRAQKSKSGYRKNFLDQVAAPTGGTSIASRRNTISGRSMVTFSDRGSIAPSMLNAPLQTIDVDLSKLPPYEPQRRALRSWLRDTLSVRTVGHQKETAAFLLLGAVRPKEKDIRDMQRRELIDQERRTTRLNVAQTTADRVKSLHDFVVEVQNECVHGEGLANLSDAIRQTPQFEDLPQNFLRAAEWNRTNIAQSIYDLLVAGEHSSVIFATIKSLNSQFPWFLVRQALKLPRSSMMATAMQDILLSKKFGQRSLLQKILAATLDDEPIKLYNELDAIRTRIQSPTMCEKLYRFVHAPRDVKETIRRHAQSNNLELVVTIVRGADLPRLDKVDLDRIVKAAKTYRSFVKKTNPTPLGKFLVDNPHVRLILDLQKYLKLLSKQRDAAQIRSMLADEQLTDALEVLVSPLMEFLKRTYKIGNASSAILDLQKFLDQLIIIVEALRSRIQDPQKSVKVISRLLARHTQPLYSYIHSVHQNDTIVEEFFQWCWTCSLFLRRGLAQTLDLDSLLPKGEEDRDYLLGEIDELVEYQKHRKRRAYELMCRRYAADVDGDDPVIVDGDGQGKSRVEPLLEPEPQGPRLVEIPRCLENFRRQLVKIFAA
ncbi:hypothetical protein BT69DRAFT_282266 [Atractiella rhizophila]|nr:hypothetical protein BT69DRAFT_282266 [Atractiella rhizophila]